MKETAPDGEKNRPNENKGGPDGKQIRESREYIRERTKEGEERKVKAEKYREALAEILAKARGTEEEIKASIREFLHSHEIRFSTIELSRSKQRLELNIKFDPEGKVVMRVFEIIFRSSIEELMDAGIEGVVFDDNLEISKDILNKQKEEERVTEAGEIKAGDLKEGDKIIIGDDVGIVRGTFPVSVFDPMGNPDRIIVVFYSSKKQAEVSHNVSKNEILGAEGNKQTDKDPGSFFEHDIGSLETEDVSAGDLKPGDVVRFSPYGPLVKVIKIEEDPRYPDELRFELENFKNQTPLATKIVNRDGLALRVKPESIKKGDAEFDGDKLKEVMVEDLKRGDIVLASGGLRRVAFIRKEGKDYVVGLSDDIDGKNINKVSVQSSFPASTRFRKVQPPEQK